MRICPTCQRSYNEGAARCPDDGRRLLTVAAFERAMEDPLIGTVLADRYEIIDRLGVGGMGTVYRAEQRALGRDVAVKVLRRELGRDPDTVARFHREALALSNLRHPNTVAVLDFGQTADGLLFLVMEVLDGEMLSTRLRREGALPVFEALRITTGMLRSLGEAHRAGIVHRDLKPDNIFLARVDAHADADEVVKVVDFGVAKIRPGPNDSPIDPVATQEGTVFGTPRYMSPEQAQGRTLDGRSDLYAVGVMLFQMLTGTVPFGEDDAVVVMAHHITTPAPRVLDVAPDSGIHPELDELVASTLKKRPADRPESAEAFLRAIEALPVEGARAGITSGPFAGAVRTSMVTATRAATALALALAFGIAGFATLSSRRGPPRPATATPASVVTTPPHPPAPPPAAPVTPAPAVVAAPNDSREPIEVTVTTREVSADAPRRRAHHRSRRHRSSPPPTASSVPSAPTSSTRAPYPRWD